MPCSKDELWEILEKPETTRLYCGGTDFLVQLRGGLIDAQSLICLERIKEFQYIEDLGDELKIGSCLTHSKILDDPLVSTYFPVLTMAISRLGSPPIRHMGTIGGNVVNASPAGDTIPALFVLEAKVEVESKDRKRLVPIEDFVLGPGKSIINHGEVVTNIIIPKRPKFRNHHFEKVGLRKGQACAVASIAAVFNLSEEGVIEEIRLAWGSLGPKVIRSKDLETELQGHELSHAPLKAFIPKFIEKFDPIDDVRASAEYRTIVGGNLLLRLTQYHPTAVTSMDKSSKLQGIIDGQVR